MRLEPLGPDSGVLSWGGNQAFSTGSALGSAISRRTTSPNGPHILHPHCSGRALKLLSYKQPPKPARTASKTDVPRPPRGRLSGAPAAGFGLDSDHFCASFESIWITKDLGFGLISSRAFQRCTGLVLNRKIQIFINFLTPPGGASSKTGAGGHLNPGIKLVPEC